VSDLRALERLEPQFWRAPSAHNTQPWLLTYGPDRIQLAYDPARALPAGDPTQRDLLLSLGAFVETVLIVAADVGTSLEFEPAPEVEPQRVGAFVQAPEPYETSLTRDDVARRQTSRLAYVPIRVSPDELADARDHVAEGAELHELEARDLVDLVEEADRHLYESDDVAAELRAWLRLTPRHPRYAVDGLSYNCLDLSRLQATAVSLLLRRRVLPAVRKVGLHRSFSDSTTKLLEHEGSAFVLVADAGSAQQVLGHGRSLCRVWLALGRHGLHTHPLSQIIDCPATEHELASRVGAPGRRVLSVFRVGRSKRPARSHRMRRAPGAS
jgi:hypothetical protein